ncbi:TonB-dependent receptor domain-containing protein, partial [Escherichia coli]|uniref:TonB-dependent receptor domain-containing protein n=1 Tax=Escherichia coli TaxID=562 RepID=UPI001BC8520E
FYIDFDDELQYVSNDVGWTNLGATKHQGIETSGHYDFAALDPRLDGLSVYGNLTYTRATYEGDIPSFKGRDLPLYSRQVATAGVRYEVDRWTYNLDAFAQSMQRAPGLSTDSQGNFTHNFCLKKNNVAVSPTTLRANGTPTNIVCRI